MILIQMFENWILSLGFSHYTLFEKGLEETGDPDQNTFSNGFISLYWIFVHAITGKNTYSVITTFDAIHEAPFSVLPRLFSFST